MNLKTKAVAEIGGLLFFFILALNGIVGALCFPYAINTWLVYADKAPVFLWWWGFLLAYIPAIGQLALPAAVITFIIMLFI